MCNKEKNRLLADLVAFLGLLGIGAAVLALGMGWIVLAWFVQTSPLVFVIPVITIVGGIGALVYKGTRAIERRGALLR